MAIFTWWNGSTFGTWLSLLRAEEVGHDATGNRYYLGGKGADGERRRFVRYNGLNDASRIAPEWHGWLHRQIDNLPDTSLPPARRWEKEARANLTGTREAYRPAGSLEAGGVRAAATGDYEPWTPDGA